MSLTDEQLRDTLGALPIDVDFDGDLSRVRERTRTRRRRRGGAVAVGAVLALVLAVVGGALVLSAGRSQRDRSVVGVRPTPTVTPPTSPVAAGTETVPADAVAKFDVDPHRHAGLIALSDGAVWIGSFAADGGPCHLGCGRVDRIDPSTGNLTASVTIAKNARAMTVSDGVLWVLADVPDGSPLMVIGVDTRTDEVIAEHEVTGTSVQGDTARAGIASGAGSVWAYFGSLLIQVDPETGAVVRTATLPTAPSIADAIFGNATDVWIVRNGGSSLGVWTLDAATLEVAELAQLPAGFIQSAAFDGRSLWLTEFDGTRQDLFVVDPASGAVTRTGNASANVAAGAGRVWFQGFAAMQAAQTHPGWAVEVDPSTGRQLRAAPFDFAGISQPGLAVDATTLWILSDNTLWRIRP